MLRFRSHSEHSLDLKSRLNIPARFRDVLREQYHSENLIVTHWDKCLRAYPVAEWEAFEEKLLTKGAISPDFVRYVIAGATECPLDKQGRILLPLTLRTGMAIEKDVAVVGMLRHFEIWEKSVWDEETRNTRQNFGDFREGLISLDIL